MNWQDYFATRKVQRLSLPYGLPSCLPSDPAVIMEYESELALPLPEDYRHFCSQIGAGKLGNFRIFCPQPSVSSPADPRLHLGRLVDKVTSTSYVHVVAHSFPLKELVVFGQDVEEDLWLAWQSTRLAMKDFSVFCWSEEPRAPPPRLIASSFFDLVDRFSFAPRSTLHRFGLVRFQDAPSAQSDIDPDDDWGGPTPSLAPALAEPDLVPSFRPAPGR